MTFNQIVQSVREYKQALWTMGMTLRYAKDNYESLVGEGINTWASFLEQPEIGMTVREANSLVQLSEWANGIRVPFEDVNLSTARFCTKNGCPTEGLEEDMSVLSLRDFKDRHYEVVNGEDAPRTYTYLVMKRCVETGNLTKVYGVEDLEAEIKEKIDNG